MKTWILAAAAGIAAIGAVAAGIVLHRKHQIYY